MATHHDVTETYRLIIARRDATEILLSPKGKDWVLPRVEIQKEQRIAEQLTTEAQKGWRSKPAAFSFQVPAYPAEMQ